MSKINNQSNSLYNIDFVQDIAPESAANYSGGAEFFFGDATNSTDIVLHKDPEGQGEAMGINAPVGELVNIGLFPGGETTFNDNVSSITTREGTWQFFTDADGGGNTGIVTPGLVNLGENDEISAIRRVS
ncbi:MAG: hypothetical protein ACRC2S_02300 [Waterburya sp.]